MAAATSSAVRPGGKLTLTEKYTERETDTDEVSSVVAA